MGRNYHKKKSWSVLRRGGVAEDTGRNFIRNLILNEAVEIFEILSEKLSEKFPILNYPSAAISIYSRLKNAAQLAKNEAHKEEFQKDCWELCNLEFDLIVFECIRNNTYKVISIIENEENRIYDCDGLQVGAIIDTKKNYATQIYFEKNKKLEIKKYIQKVFWNKFGNSIHVKYGNSLFGHKLDEGVWVLTICPETEQKIFLSEKLISFCDYILSFNDKNINRSIVFYGPTGSGKTTVSKGIAKRLNYRTITLNSSLLQNNDNQSIMEFMEFFNPEMLIMDDFDKVSYADNIYKFLEFTNEHCKLLIATINNLHSFSQNSAIIRPGRFDDLVEINKIDDRVIIDLLGEDNKDLLEKVNDWPVAYISELIKRIKILGNKYEQFEILNERVDVVKKKYEFMNKFDEEEDVYPENSKTNFKSSECTAMTR